MNEAERQARGLRADAALKEFLGPAFDMIEQVYIERMAEVAAAEPWATGKISKLAIAYKVAQEVRGQIKWVALDGEAAAAEIRRQRKIEAIPEERRRLLGLL